MELNDKKEFHKTSGDGLFLWFDVIKRVDQFTVHLPQIL